MDFSQIKCRKPWGAEWQIYDNGIISVWYLRINAGCETSLHMHANKRTAMILLNGTAHLSFLNGSKTLYALDKTNFGAGFFHRHAATTNCDLIEIEPSETKLDVHRFKDAYGREGKPYEGPENYEPLTNDDPQFDGFGNFIIGDARVELYVSQSSKELRDIVWLEKRPLMVVFLKGSLRSKQGVEVVVPGHVVWTYNLRDLLETTEPDNEMEFMGIWQTRTSTI